MTANGRSHAGNSSLAHTSRLSRSWSSPFPLPPAGEAVSDLPSSNYSWLAWPSLPGLHSRKERSPRCIASASSGVNVQVTDLDHHGLHRE